MYLGQDHCATLETQIEMMCRQLQLYDLSESEGGDIDHFEDRGEEAGDDDTGADEEGEDSEGSGGGDDDVAGDDEQYRIQGLLVLNKYFLNLHIFMFFIP